MPAPQLTPLAKTSLGDAVYEAVLEAIVSGRYPGGTVLTTVALAQQFGVSRTPVHEAIRRLSRDGLLLRVNNHKARVATFSHDEIREIYELRALLEGAAAERAARLIGDDVLAELNSAANELSRTRRAPDWPARAIEFDLQFHDAIAGACGNRRLRDDIGRYRLLVRSFCRITGIEQNLRAALNEHRTILAALEERRPAAARRAMIDHIEARLDAVLRELYGE